MRPMPAAFGAVAVALVATIAHAQEPTGVGVSPGSAILPVPTPLTLSPLFGEPTGSSGSLSPSLALLPLRLSLLSDAFPVGGMLPGDPCDVHDDARGNSAYGFPLQRQTYLPVTSRLTLHGFSRLGCPIDAAVGGGVTFAMPMPFARKDLWLVAGAGALTQPSLPGRSGVLRTDARLDLVVNPASGRPWALGIGRRGLSVSGLW